VVRAGFIVILASMLAVGAAAQPGTTERVSISSSGEQGNYMSSLPSISGDGRFIAFASHATNLAIGDSNGELDVFVRDRQSGTTERVSLSSSGGEGNDWSSWPSISADGRFVAFLAMAANLVPGDTNGCTDVFVRDRQTGTTERVSVSSSGEQANDYSDLPSISVDGRFVVFASSATNLAPGDMNGCVDIFVHDRESGTTELVSVSSSGEQGNYDCLYFQSISADGRFVAFSSYATNFVPKDTNESADVFVRDRLAGTTERVSVSSHEMQGDADSSRPSISADGRFVAFESLACGLAAGGSCHIRKVLLRDRQSGRTELVSLSSSGEGANSPSGSSSISADGRFVAFHSKAYNLVAGDTNGWGDVFLRDRLIWTTRLISISSFGDQANHRSEYPCISSDGHLVAFYSPASNLVPGDTNRANDVFVHQREDEGLEVSGTVAFQDLDGSAIPPSFVSVCVKWQGTVFGTYETHLAPDGSYGLLLPPGAFTLSIKHGHWLRQTVPADTSGGPVDGVDFSLINGDCFDDNVVDARDVAIVLARFYTYNPSGDLEGNGWVGLSDLDIVLRNFGTPGDE
jgi:Tol biopolymer transport system component